ncbi:MAG: hypothetical protein ACRC9T_04185 [Vibrionaceae bacterium]
MKKSVIGAALFSLVAFVGVSHAATTANASANQSDYKVGPPVECKLADGQVKYMPSQLCQRHGGV